MYLKCSIARGEKRKKKRKEGKGGKQGEREEERKGRTSKKPHSFPLRIHSSVLHIILFLKTLHKELWFPWGKKGSTNYNCAQWAPNIKLSFSTMAFIIPSYNVVYMIIYYLLFRRERIPYKINDFNCLINKTCINVMVK